jgi:hypothetical protein
LVENTYRWFNQMAKRWIEEVRQRGQLSVYADLDAVWKDAFRRAFILFNLFAVARDLGVILTVGTAPPNPNGPGANVQFSTFKGTAFTEGHTDWSRRSGDPPDRIAAAFLSVPATPLARTDLGKPPRPLGEEPQVLMAAHELIHACGLEDSEHTAGAPDVFSTGWIPDVGTRPEDDGLHIGQTKVPPIVFSVRIATLIRNNWR